MAEHSDMYLKDSKEPLTVTPVSLDYLVEKYPDNIDLEIMDYFGIKNQDFESICESDLPEEVESANWARRVRYFCDGVSYM
ncbi:hypothetical protein JR316_0009663 [Psilocybe cubensis]|uniref:Uncharacterized protein n=1 Tax=Psilocybe cubensis TaxID=181762 RepID=A0ACB8GPP5_PSICU|nr:hypothetical protein JR316_0009663 [Psilocybe cubensis]KAH9477450.1 hypothetical protein JR316_0009663 [Psilocybe cubensis]